MTGAELITEERKRQIEQEGWTPEHDSQHSYGELALAAMCYASPYPDPKLYDPLVHFKDHPVPPMWPWAREWWKPSPDDRKRELIKAGALIAAEIDRLQSLERKQK